MTGLDEARRLAHRLGSSHPAAETTVTIEAAMGGILATPAIARASVPSADVSAMDGWVVAGPGPWQVDGAVRMGESPGSLLAQGSARAVTTGGAVPPGTTAVLRRERGMLTDGRLRSPAEPVDGADIRRAGAEIAAGDILATAGTRVTPAVVAAAAVAGLDVLRVRRARVGLVLLGDEVVQRGVPLPGQSRDALGLLLPALLRAQGAEVVQLRHVPDDLQTVAEALTMGDVDLIVTTGGTGHGSCDHLVAAVDVIGGTIEARGLDIRPGHPVVLARLGTTPLLGLPGNPFAAVASLTAIGLPLIEGLSRIPPRPFRTSPAAATFPGTPGCTRLVAATETEQGLVMVDRQAPAMISGLLEADCIAVIGPAGIIAGDPVPTIPLPWRR